MRICNKQDNADASYSIDKCGKRQADSQAPRSSKIHEAARLSDGMGDPIAQEYSSR